MAEHVLFAEPTHVALLRRMHLVGAPNRSACNRRIVIALVVAWLPLFAINLFGYLGAHDDASLSFFRDIGVSARLLLTVPLLIAAEYVTLPRLEGTIAYLRESVVAPADVARFDDALAHARRQGRGVWPSAIVLVAAYASTIVLVMFAPHDAMPAWRLSATTYFSPAGWWHVLISMPIAGGLILAWIWRFGIWVRLLGAISRLRLRLVAAHPDGAAGLQFLAYSPRYFAPIALAIGIAMAGTLANEVMRLGLSILEHGLVPALTAAIVTLLIVSPPLLFSRVLLTAWHDGILRYGALSRRVGRVFEQKWLDAATPVDASVLGEPDFSATTDLYAIVANVYGMRLFVFDYRSAASIAVVSLLPFVPIWLTAIPLDKLLKTIAGVFL
jgi:hypothetical protein